MKDGSKVTLDEIDTSILLNMRGPRRIGVLEISRRLGVARGTVQSRLDKMISSGVVLGFGPQVDISRLGYGVTAFTTVEIVQGRIEEVIGPLMEIPEVTEAHTIAGQGDVLVRISAQSNEHLMTLLRQILDSEFVARTSTAISLAEQIPERSFELVGSESQDATGDTGET